MKACEGSIRKLNPMLELQHEAMATLPSQASLMVLLARHVAAVLVQMELVALAAARKPGTARNP